MDTFTLCLILFLWIITMMFVVASSTDNEALRKINQRLKEISDKLDKSNTQ
jgi:hypothetical protein